MIRWRDAMDIFHPQFGCYQSILCTKSPIMHCFDFLLLVLNIVNWLMKQEELTLAKSTLMIFKCNNLAWSISLWQAEMVKHKHRCIWQSRTISTSVISKLGTRKSYGGVSEIASSVPAHSSRRPMNIRLQCPTHFTSNSHWLRMESGLTFMILQPFISILKQYQLEVRHSMCDPL